MSKMHLVMGGRVKDPQTLEFQDLNQVDLVGVYPDYASAEKAWRKAIAGNKKVAEWHFRLGRILFDRHIGADYQKYVAEAIRLIEEDEDHAAPAWAWTASCL